MWPQWMHRRAVGRGQLVYSYYYASDVPLSVQNVANYAWVGALAILGVSLRVGLGSLSKTWGISNGVTGKSSGSALGDILFEELLANCLGSFFVGRLAASSDWLIIRFPAAYVGASTGFCGCLTTFSSYNYAAAVLFADAQIARGLFLLFIGFSCPYACLSWGKTASAALQRSLCAKDEPLATSFSTQSHNEGLKTRYPCYNSYKAPVGVFVLMLLLVGFSIATGFCFYLGDRTTAQVFLALVLSPFFASLRYMGAYYNKNFPKFPLFTLLCNLGGCIITTVIKEVAQTQSDADIVAMLAAVGIGAAASLSTMSTFLNEVNTLSPLPYAVIYTAATLVGGQLCALPLIALIRGL